MTHSAALLPFDLAHPHAAQAATLVDLLLLAEPLARQHFRQPLSVETKADASPVTQADKAIEAAMRALLASRYPLDGLFGEEEGISGDQARCWVIDPIDGTKAFMHGNPLYGHLVAWCLEGRPVLGGIGLSALGEMVIAATGAGAWHGRPGAWRRVACRPTDQLGAATLLSTAPDMFDAAEMARLQSVADQVRYLRWGGDCYNYVSLACGWVDVTVESQLKPYDFLPAVPVVTEAGGVMTDWQGAPLHLGSGGQAVAAATAALHRQALALLR